MAPGKPTPETERGTALVVTVAAIAAMLLFASIIVDVGFVMLARRQDQSAADAAALAAVGDRYSEDAFAATVLEVLNLNIPDANFELFHLDGCASETLEAQWVEYPSYSCLAHNRQWNEVRVRVPTQVYRTALGKLAGINEIEHTAFAQAGAGKKVAVFPFAIEAGASSYECLKSGAGNTSDCSGSNEGNFGNLNFYHFGDPADGTTTSCNQPKDKFMVNVAQGLDHDLQLYDGTAVTAGTELGLCGDSTKAPVPSGAEGGTGNTPQVIAKGIWDIADDGVAGNGQPFPDDRPARLLRLGTLPSFTSYEVDTGYVIDDTPLWAFINPDLNVSGADVPRSCWADQFVGGYDFTTAGNGSNNMDTGGMNWPDNDYGMTSLPPELATYFIPPAPADPTNPPISRPNRMIKLIERCFAHYQGVEWDDSGLFTGNDTHWNTGCAVAGMGCTDPVFSRDSDVNDNIFDIQESPRFGYVPELFPSVALGNSLVRFAAFRAIYLQRMVTGTGYGYHDPGMATAPTWGGKGVPPEVYSGTTKKVVAMTAFVFPAGILPNKLADPDAATKLGTNVAVELTR